MPDRPFFDTNILIYAVTRGDSRCEQAETLLARGGVVSVQVLNEFVSVGRRKLLMSWSEIREALEAIAVLCPLPLALTVQTHAGAMRIAEKYGYSIYDGLVIATAIEAECATLYSEDLQDGQAIEGRLKIRNPFVNPPNQRHS